MINSRGRSTSWEIMDFAMHPGLEAKSSITIYKILIDHVTRILGGKDDPE